MGIYHEPANCLITLVLNETKLQFVTPTPGYVSMHLLCVLHLSLSM